MANVDTDRGTREKIRFFDTEGIDDHHVKEIPRHFHAFADGFVIVYAIDDEHTFQIAEVLRRDIEKWKEKKEVRKIRRARFRGLFNECFFFSGRDRRDWQQD